jgi:restriction system protein
MTIPDYQTLMLPALRMAAKGEISIRDCVEVLAKEFQLSDEERAELLPSGKQTTFSNRVHWAKTYLVHAGLLEMTRRAHFKANERGRSVLAENPARIDNAYLDRFEEFRAFRARSGGRRREEGRGDVATGRIPTQQATPEEQIEAAYEEITDELRGELLDRIVDASPAFFEQVIIDLMVAMGYGGSGAEAAKRVGRSGDGGIDGLINEDILGLDNIYLQAKRYAPGTGIGVEKVREFAGSLVERGASKGVFVTTSHFAGGAKDYAERIPQKLILIDGDMLTKLMIRHGVGVRTTRTVELKKLDLDYFENEGNR